jgi:hypothetical protein
MAGLFSKDAVRDRAPKLADALAPAGHPPQVISDGQAANKPDDISVASREASN